MFLPIRKDNNIISVHQVKQYGLHKINGKPKKRSKIKKILMEFNVDVGQTPFGSKDNGIQNRQSSINRGRTNLSIGSVTITK